MPGPHHQRLLLVSALLMLLVFPFAQSHSASTPAPSSAIKHIVVIVEENHTFDNYFGTYPNANGLSGNGLLSSQTEKLAQPFHIDGPTVARDIPHDWASAHNAYDNGKMDNFIPAEGTNLTMGYFDYHQIPNYWAYASRFVLMDNYFSSVMGPSLPNHLYLLSGQSGSLTRNARAGSIDFQSATIHDSTFYFPSVVDQLAANHISWKYYAGGYSTLNNWNPLPAFASVKHNTTMLHNLAASEQFSVDVANGDLASVSWIMPATDELSEHPPYNVTAGQQQVVSLVNTIMQSEFWNSTAIFLTWDDYGGWYDHVPPPQIKEGAGSFGLGFRVPCIIISPFAKHGFVDHTQADHTSILRFIQRIHSLPSLPGSGGTASDMMEAFDFSRPLRSSLVLPGPFVPNTYPLVLLGNATSIPLVDPPAGQSLPNLTVEKLTIRPVHPLPGDFLSVNYTVVNLGNAVASGVTTSLYLNDTSHEYLRIASSGPFELRPDMSYSGSFGSTIQVTKGDHTIIVVVDDISQIREVQKDNNALVRVIGVPETPSHPSTTTVTLENTVTTSTTIFKNLTSSTTIFSNVISSTTIFRSVTSLTTIFSNVTSIATHMVTQTGSLTDDGGRWPSSWTDAVSYLGIAILVAVVSFAFARARRG